jgi:autotransporter-associated beta strand protein
MPISAVLLASTALIAPSRPPQRRRPVPGIPNIKQLLLTQAISGIVWFGTVMPAATESIVDYNNPLSWNHFGRLSESNPPPVNSENGIVRFTPDVRNLRPEWEWQISALAVFDGPPVQFKVTGNVRIGTWEFLAPIAWPFTLLPNTKTTFTGQGIVANTTGVTIFINNNAALEFTNRSQAGSATIRNEGSLSFNDFSSAGDAKIANLGTVNFNGDNSTAGMATITNSGILNFNMRSSAGDATIANNNKLSFNGNSNAGNALITNSSVLDFNDKSSAANAGIRNDGTLHFNGGSSAATAVILNAAELIFGGTSSGADAGIVNAGVLIFSESSTATKAKIANLGETSFIQKSTALDAIITNYRDISFAGESSAGRAQITNNSGSLLRFTDAARAENATIITNDGARTIFAGNSSGGAARLVANGTGAVGFGDLLSGGTTAGSIEGSGTFFLGSKTLTVGGNNLSTTLTGSIRDGAIEGGGVGGEGGSLVKAGTGGLTLNGSNSYTGPTTVQQGALIVNGSIKSSSMVTVENGAVLGGNGEVPRTIIRNGGQLAPGNSIGTLNVVGDLTFGSSVYSVEFAEASDRTRVTGTAALDGSVALDFLPKGAYLKQYSILHADGGFGGTVFNNVIAAPNFVAALSYGPNDVFLHVTPALGLGSALAGNAANVANSINGFFINNGLLPTGFAGLYDLTGSNLANALTLISGEAATGAQQVGFQMGSQFLSLMLDPFVDGRSGVGSADHPALGFAPERDAMPPEIAHAYAAVLKAPSKAVPLYEPRWSVWGGAYGGSNRTTGDLAVTGSHDLSARTVGFAGGFDYHLSRDTVVGLALAGGGTNWSLAQGLGGGKSDTFQAGFYGATKSGPAYLAAAFAFTNHWMSTDRFAFAGDHLTADFNAQSYGGRLEGGYRFGTPYGGIAPYAAIQAQSFHTPGYSEIGLIPNGFALAFNGRDATDTRSELGARFDRVLALYPDAVLALRGRLAWAHDWASDPTLTPLFQALPGASFVVNGATPAKNSALASAGAELRLANGVTLIGTFDGEFASNASTYGGTGTIRYTW